MKKSAIVKITGVSTSAILWLTLASSALAQTSSTSSATTRGSTVSSLPAAGSTELTYFLFIGGAILFVFGAVKLILSFRD